MLYLVSWISLPAFISPSHFQCDYIAIFLFSYNIVLRPVTLACGHSGCQNCMETWAESKVTPVCPQCRAKFRKEELKINVTMDKATRDLPVKCNSQGCQWKGNYSDANDHLKHCPKVRERCPNEGCQHVAAREEMTAHACPKERIACSGCQLRVTREKLQFHRRSLCRDSAALCPLRCGASLPRYVALIRIIEHCDVLVLAIVLSEEIFNMNSSIPVFSPFKSKITGSPNLCLVSHITERCDSAAFLKYNWKRRVIFHDQETIWETDIMPIIQWGSRGRAKWYSQMTLSPPSPPTIPSTGL